MSEPLKLLVHPAPPRASTWVRYTRNTTAVDVLGARWHVFIGAELELAPPEARLAVASGVAVIIPPPTN